jgi:hypothetical protein
MNLFAYRFLRSMLLVATALLLTGNGARTGAQAEPEVTLKAVKYSELGAIVRQLKGKVVAVNLWADF